MMKMVLVMGMGIPSIVWQIIMKLVHQQARIKQNSEEKGEK